MLQYRNLPQNGTGCTGLADFSINILRGRTGYRFRYCSFKRCEMKTPTRYWLSLPHPWPLSEIGEGSVLAWNWWFYSRVRDFSSAIKTQISGAIAPFPKLGKGRGWGSFVFVFRFFCPPIGETGSKGMAGIANHRNYNSFCFWFRHCSTKAQWENSNQVLVELYQIKNALQGVE